MLSVTMDVATHMLLTLLVIVTSKMLNVALRRLLIVFGCNFRVLKSTVFSNCKVSTPKHCTGKLYMYRIFVILPLSLSYYYFIIITLHVLPQCSSPIIFAC